MKRCMKRLFSICMIFVPLFSLSVTNGLRAEETSHSTDYWPTNGWRTSTPEEQGMASAKLADMFEYIKENGLNIDSVTIVKNGYIVTDAYLNPLFKPGMKHIIHSCAKSITSALIGIALEKGYIKSVDESVIEFFPEKHFSNIGERKKAITLKDLLTMSYGIRNQDSFLYKWKGLFEIMNSKDWVKFILDQPMDATPGKRFEYSNGCSFLLSAIMQKQTNMSTLSFAQQHLFEPLGITDVTWPSNPNGITLGWGGMWLSPHDMAKIGWLYLNNGRWEDKQIVPVQWVKDSTKKMTSPKSFRRVNDKNGDLMLFRSFWLWMAYNWGWSISDGYGYQWWIDDSGIFSAIGLGGQYIMVVPEKKMVVVFTSVLKGSDFAMPGRLLKEYVIPSVVSDNSIPPDIAELNRLKSFLKAGDDSSQQRQNVPPLPKIAKEISGRTYQYDANQFGFESISLTFQPNKEVALGKMRIRNTDIAAEIGLDNVFRVTKFGEVPIARKGHWIDDKTFSVNYDFVGDTKRGIVKITFTNNMLRYAFDDFMLGEIELTAQVE